MNIPPIFLAEANDNIIVQEALYQEALTNGQEFHVLKDIREAINKLRESVESNAPLTVQYILPVKRKR